MNKKSRMVVGIILIVLGVLSLIGLYFQAGGSFWVAVGVGLGASLMIIGLPCLGTFLIYGYKEKEKVEKIEVKEEKNNKTNSKRIKKYLDNDYKIYLVISFLVIVCIGIVLFFTLNLDLWIRLLILIIFALISIVPLIFCFLKRRQ